MSDEDLLLDYYGESSAAERAGREGHLASCESCRAADRELRAVLALIDTSPGVDAPPGFGREMWARVEPVVSARTTRSRSWWRVPSRWALAGGMAALLIGSFTLGRVWERAPRRLETPVVRANDISERLLRLAVEDHLERSQRVLVDLVNADDSTPGSRDDDRSRAADLVAAGRLYRQSAAAAGDVEMRQLLEDVERVLVDVANEPANEVTSTASKPVTDIRARISEQDLLFRLRLASAEMRERERRARATW